VRRVMIMIGAKVFGDVSSHGIRQAFKKLDAERRRQGLEVVRGPQIARGRSK
jgi:hypothetical protein